MSSATALNSSRIRVFVKLPTTSAGQSTGWMDLATAFSTGQVSDNSGAFGHYEIAVDKDRDFSPRMQGQERWVLHGQGAGADWLRGVIKAEFDQSPMGPECPRRANTPER